MTGSSGITIARPAELAARIKAIARKIREQSELPRDTVEDSENKDTSIIKVPLDWPNR